MPTPFQAVLHKFRKQSFSERDKGARFERLMQAYFLTDPKYAPQFKKTYGFGMNFLQKKTLAERIPVSITNS